MDDISGRVFVVSFSSVFSGLLNTEENCSFRSSAIFSGSWRSVPLPYLRGPMLDLSFENFFSIAEEITRIMFHALYFSFSSRTVFFYRIPYSHCKDTQLVFNGNELV